MQRKIVLLFVVVLITTNSVFGQSIKQDTTFRKFFVGSTFMMLGNLLSDEQTDFFQLNFGYRITPKDVVSIEAITWKYAWPLGISWGDSFDAPEEKFPGYIREFGIGFAYQRFWWKGLYTGIHALNASQQFFDEDNIKIKNGYQLFMTYRLGYHLSFFKNRFFIEPSIAITHRPIHTKMPESFAEKDNKWSKFFFGEPGLHFGFNF
ncbi:MAG: hypothetical protein LBI82_00055 [Dysgonamonadaceae bacterium]|jgi:hypothetical protein|nr:hypothetical protein [Dysgonamonadaceae bacterium]